MRNFLASVIAVFAVASAATSAAFDYSAYKPSSIQGIISEHHDTFLKDAEEIDYSFSGVVFKYRVAVEYTGKLRDMDSDKKFFLDQWVKSVQYDSAFVDLYKREMLVREDGEDHWIPVQEQLLPYMEDELAEGSKFHLYVAFIGTSKGKWVFLATDFDAR